MWRRSTALRAYQCNGLHRESLKRFGLGPRPCQPRRSVSASRDVLPRATALWIVDAGSSAGRSRRAICHGHGSITAPGRERSRQGSVGVANSAAGRREAGPPRRVRSIGAVGVRAGSAAGLARDVARLALGGGIEKATDQQGDDQADGGSGQAHRRGSHGGSPPFRAGVSALQREESAHNPRCAPPSAG